MSLQYLWNMITNRSFYGRWLQNSKMNPLGRWKLDYCDKKVNRKIDMSNEDHCGPCGQYKK